jgi:hypothetical protein
VDKECESLHLLSVLKTVVLVSLSCHRAYQVGCKRLRRALSGRSSAAIAEKDMHLRQIADDTACDAQHHPSSASRKMTPNLRIGSSSFSNSLADSHLKWRKMAHLPFG